MCKIWIAWYILLFMCDILSIYYSKHCARYRGKNNPEHKRAVHSKYQSLRKETYNKGKLKVQREYVAQTGVDSRVVYEQSQKST